MRLGRLHCIDISSRRIPIWTPIILARHSCDCNKNTATHDVTGVILPATHGTGANESDASAPANARVVGTDWYWEARTARVTRLITVSTVTEPSVSDRRRHEVDVVVDELSPLHQHVTVLVVRRHSRRRQHTQRYGAGTWQSHPVIQSVSVPACNSSSPLVTTATARQQ